MKKICLLALLAPLFLSGVTAANVVNEGVREEKDFVVYEERLNDNFKTVGTLRESVIGDVVTATSGTYVQYGRNSENKDLLRFATAVKGNLDSLSYTLSYSGVTETYEVSTVYEAISVEGQHTYYNGEDLSTDLNNKGLYYWACITIQFNSEKEVNTEFTASLSVLDKDNNTVNSDSYTTTLGTLKHDGYTIANQTNNNTVITKGEGTVTITNDGHWDWSPQSRNIVLVNDLTYTGDYELSVDITLPGVSYPIAGLHNQGIVFYYVDDNNYLIAYTNYSNEEDRLKNIMREIQITGVINGQHLPWGDFWMDGVNGDSVAPNKVNTLTIVKKGSKVYPYINNQPIGMWGANGYQYYYEVAGADLSATSRVGYHVDTESGKKNTVTFSDIRLEKISGNLYSRYNWNNIGVDNSVWSVNSENKTIISTNTNWMGNFYICDELVSENVSSDDSTISVNLKGTMGLPVTKEIIIGIVPWFVDLNNFVVVFAQWHPNDRAYELREFQMTGRINGNFLPVWDNGWVNREWNDMWIVGEVIAPNADLTFSVTKRVTNGDSIRFEVTLTDGVTSVTRENGFGILNTGSLLPAGKMGLWSQNDTVTFSNISKILLNA